ncbi:MAG: MBL fold metallo-hydrolase [Fulvivirga sp.]|uniref:MBL fold metallo-hydrolase n=1 Tax=Fulvivirga sp. TaxID=1931237 RepID=UPI0032EBA5CD
MNVRVKFLGAAQTVTGSKYLFEIDDFTFLVDCGLFQGLKPYRLRNWDEFPHDVTTIDAVVLTHAHIDHSGYLPRLVKQGFNGLIYCTEATAGLLEILLLDAAKLQEEEAEFAKKKGYSKHANPEPLFTTENAEQALSLVTTVGYDQDFRIHDNVQVTFRNAGHILGSAFVELLINGTNMTKKVVLSGDLGRFNQPLLASPETVNETDVLFVESTYGDRNNEITNVEEQLKEKVNKGLKEGGCILIPSFAVGRTQIILYYLQKLQSDGSIPNVSIYIDSPMAISATNLYSKYPDYHTLTASEFKGNGLFDYPTVHYYRSQESSVILNDITSNAIIISASGMCTGGRILHHLFHRLGRKNDTLLFVGYQAEGTRGRRILEGEPTSRIFGIDVEVKCHVDIVSGLSAHADMSELHQWLDHLTSSPKMTFIVHGEAESSLALAHHLRIEKQWDNVYVPNYLESFDLFRGI